MNRTLLPLTILALLLASCDKGASSGQDEEAPTHITVEAQVGAMTRATTTGNSTVFDEGDKLSLYAWTDNQNTTPQSFVVDGVSNTLLTNGKWVPEQEMLWQDMVTLHYFLGIYPTRRVENLAADPFTLDDTDYEKSDLLYALVPSGMKATENPVPLIFDHAMAKLYVNMNFRTQWNGKPNITACKAKAANSCTINYLAKEITPTLDADATVTLTEQPVADNDNFAAKYRALMIPQKTGFRTVTITIDGKNYTYTHNEDIPLVSGKITTLNLIVGRNKIEIGTVSIKEWEDGETIDGGQAYAEGEEPTEESTVVPITVTWDNMNNTGDGTYSQDGVTLTSIPTSDYVYAHFYNNFYDYGTNTFTTTLGKFTKIEIICTYADETAIGGWDKVKIGQYQPYPDDDPDRWDNIYRLTWTGEAESVTICASIYGIQSITFTIE